MTKMLPSRYLGGAKPVRIKKAVAALKHISAPLKGLSMSSKLQPGDPLTATVLDNFVIEENQVRCRAGSRLVYSYPDASKAFEAIVPYYGDPDKLAGAIDGKLVLFDGTVVKAGFTSNDWSWTAFSNLSDTDYTVMVNGKDGVWSWDGNPASTPPTAVTVTSLSNSNPARCTVAAADIGRFSNGMVVTIAGAAGAGLVNANGARAITNVNTPANTFTLVGVDTSGGAAPQTSGVTATVPGTGLAKEVVTAPASAPYIVPDQFDIVVAHMNRLWFADKTNLALYYLPLQQKAGEVKVLPLNAVFRRGGSIRAMYTWTTGDGGVNLNDQLCIFSSNGECVMYGGTDPESDFELAGIFRFDAPLSKRSVVNYGGELYVLISNGLTPMTTLMRAETEKLNKVDQDIFSHFSACVLRHRDRPGWEAFINPSSGRIFCNMPQGGGVYTQLVRFMPKPVWSTWSGLNSRCWGWADARVFFGTDNGRIYEIHPSFLNDDGKPIRIDVQPAWSQFGTPAYKQFKMVQAYVITDGDPKPFIDVRTNYNQNPPTNQPDVTYGVEGGAVWDVSNWDEDYWPGNTETVFNWTGVAAKGYVGAPRLVALISNCEFALAGFDVLYEQGSIFG